AVRAVGRELTQQRRELSLHLDHLAGLVQLGLQTLVLLTQPGVLPLHRVRRRPTRRLREGRQRGLVTLLTPRPDQRRVQALPAPQRPLTGLVQPVVLLQDPRLVRRGRRPRPRLRRHLRIRHLVTQTHWGWLLARPLRTRFLAQILPHTSLTERGSAGSRNRAA